MGCVLCSRHWSKCLVMFNLHIAPKTTPLLFPFTWEDEDSQTHQELTQATTVDAGVWSQSECSRAQAFIHYIFKWAIAMTSNYKIISDFFSFFNMTAFSSFPTPQSFMVKNTYKIRTKARCCSITIQYMIAERLWHPLSSAHDSSSTQKLLNGLWEAAMFATALAHQGPSAFLGRSSVPTQRHLHRVFCLSPFQNASIPGPNNCYHSGPARLG